MKKIDFTGYVSPLTWRYGSSEMRELFSEEHKYRIWRKIWVALARAQHKAGLVVKNELDDLVATKPRSTSMKLREKKKQTRRRCGIEFASVARIGGVNSPGCHEYGYS